VEHKKNVKSFKNVLMTGAKKMVTRFSGANIGRKENGHEKNYNKNLYENPFMDSRLDWSVELLGLDQVE
tara:strand:+ start:2760 stop:2966 length:207 start_codon:yes stop_codon:yes gene_type:complete